jgi:hypothetical protein
MPRITTKPWEKKKEKWKEEGRAASLTERMTIPCLNCRKKSDLL